MRKFVVALTGAVASAVLLAQCARRQSASALPTEGSDATASGESADAGIADAPVTDASAADASWPAAAGADSLRPYCDFQSAPRDWVSGQVLAWEAVNSGRSRATFPSPGWLPASSTSFSARGASAILAYSAAELVDGGVRDTFHVWDLTRGALIGALRIAYASTDGRPRGVFTRDLQSANVTTVACGDPDAQSGWDFFWSCLDLDLTDWSIAQPLAKRSANPSPMSYAAFRVGDGGLIRVGGGAADALLDLRSSIWTHIGPAPNPGLIAAEEASAIWQSGVADDGGAVLSLVSPPAAGVRATITVPGSTTALALSPQRLVALEDLSGGSNQSGAPLTRPAVWWESRDANGLPAGPARVTQLAMGPLAGVIRTAGDWVLVVATGYVSQGAAWQLRPGDETFALAVNVSAGRGWVLRPGSGERWLASVASLDSQYAYVATAASSNPDANGVDGVLRFDLSAVSTAPPDWAQ